MKAARRRSIPCWWPAGLLLAGLIGALAVLVLAAAGIGPGLTAPAAALVPIGALAGLAGLAAIVLRRSLRCDRELEQLRGVARALAEGRLPEGVPVDQTSGPVADLARALERLRHRAVRQARLDQEKERTDERIRHQATYDTLTDLPNRPLFLDRLTQALAKADRDQRLVGVLFIDLDRFKAVNDGWGHEAGDEVLRATARRLQDGLRRSDTVARLGGDEFTVIIPDLRRTQDLQPIARKLLEAVARPIPLGNSVAEVTASLGIAVSPYDGTAADELLRHADQAMYRAKRAGRDGHCFFMPEMNAQSAWRGRIETRLRRAIAEDEFSVEYQPLFDIGSGDIVAAEAVLRWHQGEPLPHEFRDVAEDSGLMVPLGDLLVSTIMRDAGAWLDAGPPHFRVAVDLTARQLRDPRLLDRLARHRDAHAFPMERLLVELGEDLILPERAIIRDRIVALRRLGLTLAVDRFGSGYGSIGSLRGLPLSLLKIDPAFIAHLSDDPQDAALVQAIIVLAHGLGLRVGAAGIATPQQLSILRANGCDYAQGPLLAAALPLPALLERLAGPDDTRAAMAAAS